MEQVDRYRKRLRGYAGFFFIVGAIQLSASVVGFASDAFLTFTQAVGLACSGAVLVAGAVMAWNGARTGAISILAWLVFNLAWQVGMGAAVSTGTVRYLIYIGLALMMCVNAFRYWRAVKAEEGARIRGMAALRWGGLVVMLPVATLSMIGLAEVLIPSAVSSSIVPGDRIPKEHLAWMRENNFLLETETPLLFYSAGTSSIAEDGNLLTNRFIGSWWQADGELQITWTRLGQVCEVYRNDDHSSFGLHAYTIRELGDATSEFDIWLPAGDALHDDFLSRLDYLNEHHSNAELKAACEEGRDPDWQEVARLNGIPVGFVDGKDIPQRVENWLRGKKYLVLNEEPIWLNTTAIYDLRETGTMLSSHYFGGWYEDSSGALNQVWYDHAQICAVSEIEEEAGNGLRWFEVTSTDPEDWYKFELPEEDARIDDYLAQLQDRIDGSRTEENLRACAQAGEAAADG